MYWLDSTWLGVAFFMLLPKHDSQLDKYFSFCYYCCSLSLTHPPPSHCLSLTLCRRRFHTLSSFTHAVFYRPIFFHGLFDSHKHKMKYKMMVLSMAWRARNTLFLKTLWHTHTKIISRMLCTVLCREKILFIHHLAHLNWYILFVLLYNNRSSRQTIVCLQLRYNLMVVAAVSVVLLVLHACVHVRSYLCVWTFSFD